ncbi:MAG TPA: aspartyl/asparaginyl beta-hydroxylase domain-containing protein [Sphingomicrobium sp.]
MYPNPRKTQSIRPLGTIDVTRLREAVLAIPETRWNVENSSKPNRFETLSSTRHIVFRFVSNFVDWRESYDRPAWDEWKGVLEPVLAAATADYGYARGAFPRVMLARMAPGGEIEPHNDSNPAAQWPHKIHIPILTNPDVTFFVDDVAYHFAEGEAVEVNNMATHAVTNRGNTDRIHLIFEYFDLDQPEPDWIEPLVRMQPARRAGS